MGAILEKRLERLCDPGSYTSQFDHPGAVSVTGAGKINGRPAVVIATDPEPPLGKPDLAATSSRLLKALHEAETAGCPVVFLHDAPALYHSGRTAFQGAFAELMMGDEGVGRQYYQICRLSRQVPLVCGVFGAMAQAQAFPVAMCHGVAMLESASLSVARPDAVKAMIGEELSESELGGAAVHSRVTGTCQKSAPDENGVIDWIRGFLSYLPQNTGLTTPGATPEDPSPEGLPLSEVIPTRLKEPFDARQAIRSIVDRERFLELSPEFAGEVVTGFVRVEGRAAGIVANHPVVRGGVLFAETCRKIDRFVSFCDAFNLPLVFLADAPGFMIGRDAERAGIVEAGARLFAAIARCRVPRLCIVLRRAYTAGLYAMSGSGFSPDGLYALPGASISVYGPEAVDRFLRALDMEPEKKEEIRKEMEKDRRLDRLLEKGYLSGIVPPEKVRKTIADFLHKSGGGF